MVVRTLVVAAVLMLLPSATAAEVRWVTVTEQGVAVYKQVDSAGLVSLAFFRDAKQRMNVRWETETGTSVLYEADDVAWARSLLKGDEFVRVDFINNSGVTVAESSNEQHWRWSMIEAVRCTSNPTVCHLWSKGMIIGKATNIRVTRSDERAKVMKLIDKRP